MALTNEEVQRELQDMKTKVYLPSSYNDVAARFAELVTNHLNDETRDAFFGESKLARPFGAFLPLSVARRRPSAWALQKQRAQRRWRGTALRNRRPLLCWGREKRGRIWDSHSVCGLGCAAVLEAASKNIGKEEFGFMPTKKIFVTSYHTKANAIPNIASARDHRPGLGEIQPR